MTTSSFVDGSFEAPPGMISEAQAVSPVKDRTGAVKVAAGLNLAWGGILLIAAVLAGIVFTAGVDYATRDGDPGTIEELKIIRAVTMTLLILMGLPYIIGGSAVFGRKSWGRPLLFTVSGLGTLLIPFGTIIAIVSFWALTRPGAEPWFGADS